MPARCALPIHSRELFATDGGIETWLMYKKGFELPHFASFYLLDIPAGRKALRECYRSFVAVAQRYQSKYIFYSLTYRASRDWRNLLGYSKAALADMNHKAYF
jgi:S-methylmethionine-dependent homocysteine/selenocysteine methylase